MPQGIIQVSSSVFKGYFDLTIDPALIDLGKLKEAFLLPDRYTVEQVRRAAYWHIYDIEVLVSSPGIPETEESAELPCVSPCYCYEHSADGKTRTISLHDILIDGTSVIREEDKERRVTIEIKEIKDTHADARDTQFIGYAKALYNELREAGYTAENYDPDQDIYRDFAIELIAQRAYDLAHHVVENVSAYNMSSIPDLTEWPKDKSP